VILAERVGMGLQILFTEVVVVVFFDFCMFLYFMTVCWCWCNVWREGPFSGLSLVELGSLLLQNGQSCEPEETK
jgi:hypothetical protein